MTSPTGDGAGGSKDGDGAEAGGAAGDGKCESLSSGAAPVSTFGAVSCNEPGRRVSAAAERRLAVSEVALRCAACLFGALAAALLGGDRQSRVFFSSFEKVARFTDIVALEFLVIVVSVAAAYSLVQVAAGLFSMVRGSSLHRSRHLAWAVFSIDQAMAYVTASAFAAAAQAGAVGQFGQPELQWMKTCGLFHKFCNQSGTALAFALLVTASSAMVATLSAFNVFRLYRGCWRPRRSSSIAGMSSSHIACPEG